jgi:hypothetical protein
VWSDEILRIIGNFKNQIRSGLTLRDRKT